MKKILPLGLDYSSQKIIFEPIDEKELAESISGFLDKNVKRLTKSTGKGMQFSRSKKIKRPNVVDPNNPKQAGWTFLINKNDRARRAEIINAIRPLAEHRGMETPDFPLEFDSHMEKYDWDDWIINNYKSLDMRGGKPLYVLIVGGPQDIPIHFQAELDLIANVGRVDFDSIDDLKTYVEKIIRLENADNNSNISEATFFGTNHGIEDPTYFSSEFMVKPLAKYVENDLKLKTLNITGQDATKEKLLNTLKQSKSGLVYSASHGMTASDESPEIQEMVTGGICCEHNEGQPIDDWLLTASDISFKEPFLEGSIFFQFACLGFGTPKESDLNHWWPQSWGLPQQIAHDDFSSALPKKLLAHPKGPLGYIGHYDNAILHGFDDPSNPFPEKEWSPRIQPFYQAVKKLLQTHTLGEAMNDINERYSEQNARTMRLNDQAQRNEIEKKDKFFLELSDAFLMSIDSRNFLCMGDPAVYLRMNMV